MTVRRRRPERIARPRQQGVIGVIREVIRSPVRFFRQSAREHGIHRSLFFYTIYALFVSLFATFAAYFAYPKIYDDLYYLFRITLGNYVTTFSISYYLFAVIQTIISVFVLAGIAFFMLRLFHGKGNFAQTFNAMAYAYAPGFILTPIVLLVQAAYFVYNALPLLVLSTIISIPFLVYIIWLQVTGLSIAHKVSRQRALLAAYIVPLLVLILLSVLLVFFSPTFGLSLSTARLIA